MSNYELHEAAQQLADTETAYSLARRVVELERKLTPNHKPNLIIPDDALNRIKESFKDD